MGLVFLILFIIFGLFSILIYILCISDYNAYIEKMSEENTFDEISDKINTDRRIIDSGRFSGSMLKSIFDHKKFWEQIQTYKLRKNRNV